MIAILVGFERFLPRVPAPLVAVGGRDRRGVGCSGCSPSASSSWATSRRAFRRSTLPDLSLAAGLWTGAMGIALMSFTETVAAGRAFARGDEPPPRANRELLATGLGNAAGAFLGAMPSGGGTSQTAVNRHAGARSQLAEIVTAGVTLATMFLLAPADRPDAPGDAGRRRRRLLDRADQAGGVPVDPPRPADRVRLGARGVRRRDAARNPQGHPRRHHPVARWRSPTRWRTRPCTSWGASPAPTSSGRARRSIPRTRPSRVCSSCGRKGRVFFANAERIGQKMRAFAAEAQPKVVALDMSAVFDLEYTALKMLTEGERRNREQGVELWLVGLTPDVLAMVQRSPLGADPGPRAHALQPRGGRRPVRGALRGRGTLVTKTSEASESRRLTEAREAGVAWRKWGPYLSERQWGTVREDYSESGDAWSYFSHDQARSRAYRWGEDGLARHLRREAAPVLRARSLERQRSDPEGAALRPDQRGGKPRRGRQGVLLLPRLDADALVHEVPLQVSPRAPIRTETSSTRTGGARRTEPEYELLDTGVFADGRYFDVFVEYAKASPEDILIRITARQPRARGRRPPPSADPLVPQHLDLVAGRGRSPFCERLLAVCAAVAASHPEMGDLWLYVRG